MATPHINAELGDFAPAVLMPGDPKRAERIAHLLMDDAKLVTDVRGMLGFTGTINGRPLSVMGSGMGQPSATIYATELFKFFGVERIIRVGTCGGISPKVKVGDVVVALGAHTDSSMNTYRIPGINFSAVASFKLAAAAVAASKDAENVHVGTILSRDHFYLPVAGQVQNLADYGVLGVEMEAAAMYGVAAEFGKEALTVLTVSDHLLDGSSDMTAEERETKFRGALDLAVAAAFA
ncbi:purine-nucleoside phosphorylase [Gleimia sp. 6138-11-ORH1]|uniref:purine-nucleoside phosphorylase n=1 Tax=Gleimia sp. 6138-11-ORH1 TaxID=2973937 RepID=UPI0021685A95|nr:purine-nucleoside phosphorylase [Gleimia sp. 6138-11-ORH1]MCS4484461.1 purine-nucleoside phosphorylase [Gleimia sp. 6138-11-ORH1]